MRYGISPYEINNLTKPLIKFYKDKQQYIIQISPETVEGQTILWISIIPFENITNNISWGFSDISKLNTKDLNSKKILNLPEMGGIIFSISNSYIKIIIKNLIIIAIYIVFFLLILKINSRKSNLFLNKNNSSVDEEKKLIFLSEVNSDYLKKSEQKLKKNEIFEFIHSNFHKDISLVDLSEFLGCSDKYASILFRQITGNNFKDYLTNHRMKIANEIIISNKNIKIFELASLVGYNSSNSFIRAYKKVYGTSPKKSN
ncbi:MAG: helix-turn-helix transcriptional regulator [Fusobacteriaceae bacterium]